VAGKPNEEDAAGSQPASPPQPLRVSSGGLTIPHTSVSSLAAVAPHAIACRPDGASLTVDFCEEEKTKKMLVFSNNIEMFSENIDQHI
jgi:hypothetical protein